MTRRGPEIAPNRILNRDVHDRLGEKVLQGHMVALGQRVVGWKSNTAWLAEERAELDSAVLELPVQNGHVSRSAAQSSERIEPLGEVDG